VTAVLEYIESALTAYCGKINTSVWFVYIMTIAVINSKTTTFCD